MTDSNLSTLHDAVQQLSLSSQSSATSKDAHSLKEALGRIKLVSKAATEDNVSFDGQREGSVRPAEQERLEWMVLGKVTTRAYGLVLEHFLREIVPLEQDISYWRDVLGSYRYTSLYSIQTSPLRMWHWSRAIWVDVRNQQVEFQDAWHEFYRRVKTTTKDWSLRDVKSTISLPVTLIRSDLQAKQDRLQRLKRQYAGAIGFMLAQGFETSKTIASTDSASNSTTTLRRRIARHLSAMDFSVSSILRTSQDREQKVPEEEASVLTVQPATANDVSTRLQKMLQSSLPEQAATIQAIKQENGRPPFLVRWWLPGAALLLSSSTILRILFRRRNHILTWIRELGQTTLDFYLNWVVEPGRRLIGTIRHDEGSEVSIMSKESLQGDRSSLERMVVDFAVQNPEGPKLTESDIADLRAKVQAGDLTPVLRAYEQDLKSPIKNSFTGTLIRTLLIQVQKTKVDVEVAMGGIDALLKSQELVFGFISLTPGLLVLIGAYRWLTGLFSNRRSFRRGRTQEQSLRLFAEMDRILTEAQQVDKQKMDYESFGLLVCEAIVLRDLAAKAMPKQVFADFARDFDGMLNVHAGVELQKMVVDRMRWAYTKWLL